MSGSQHSRSFWTIARKLSTNRFRDWEWHICSRMSNASTTRATDLTSTHTHISKPTHICTPDAGWRMQTMLYQNITKINYWLTDCNCNCNWGTCIEDRGCITESIRTLVPVNKIKQKCFQITTKRVHQSQQFQLRRQPVPCSPCSNRKGSVANLWMCLRNDKVAKGWSA